MGCRGRMPETGNKGARALGEKRVTFVGHSPAPKVSVSAGHENQRTVFLLSPANSSGIRARMLLRPNAEFRLARRLRESSVPLGEVFSFISGLYFRGKLSYAERFTNPPPGVPGIYVITAAAGLLVPEEPMTRARLQSISATEVDPQNSEYRIALDRDALRLRKLLEPTTQVVLLGSIATPKYVSPLLEIFGERLYFPKEFIGRGDMSRGGLLLRCCSLGVPLEYAAVLGAPRRGKRPPKLKKLVPPALP
jgi:hypothetical protein